jgi:predicted DNA-binding transcriptional regulator AlpA
MMIDKKTNVEVNHRLPDDGYLRIWQIIGGKGYPAIIPISKSSLWKAIHEKRIPAPVHLGPRTSAWKTSAIRAYLDGTWKAEDAQ